MTKYAPKYVRRKKAMENGRGSREEKESRDPGREDVGDGRLQRQECGNSSRKRRVRFACEEVMERDEGGKAIVSGEEGKVTEGTANGFQYQSPMKLRSRDRGGRRKVMYDDGEDGGGLAKKRVGAETEGHVEGTSFGSSRNRCQ